MSNPKLSLINKAKVSHDIDQLLYLKKIGLSTPADSELIRNLEALKGIIEQSNRKVIEITDLIETLVGADYLFSSLPREPQVTETILLNAKAFESPEILSFADKKRKIFIFDNVLKEFALDGIRKFFIEGRIWFEVKEEFNYLFTDARYGMRFELLKRFQTELKTQLEPFVGSKILSEAWAIKYDLVEEGILAHADQVAGQVTCNFWMTPTSSNLDSTSGGMTVLNLSAPENWPWPVAITDSNKIADFIDQKKPEEISIPYKENRLVVFDSELFHKTNKIHFGPSYEDRRISLTHIYK